MAASATPSKSHRVTVEPRGIAFEAEDGETIMDAAQRCGYRWPTLCNGDATCSICWVEVTTGAEYLSDIEARERETLDTMLTRRQAVRLACQARVNGMVTVRKNGVREQQADFG
jgi:2Fe-2S ferredoxin